MPVRSKTYYPTAGTFVITDPSIAYVTLLKVAREGLGHEIVFAAPGNREVKYSSGLGSIEVEQVYNEDEKVFVLYKY